MISFTKKLSTKFHFLVNNWHALDIIFQSPCLLCDAITLNKSKICKSCLADLEWNVTFCKQCSLPMNSESCKELICGECLSSPPPFKTCVAPFNYSFPINSIIYRVKSSGEQYWLKSLSLEFCRYLELYHKDLPQPDFIVPIPLHRDKLKERGFNQAESLAVLLGKHQKLAVNTKLIVKSKMSADQKSLNKVQRLINLKGCFTIDNPQVVKDKHIVLVDDVVTTKATSEICSQLLLDKGASRVDIWSLARTPKAS